MAWAQRPPHWSRAQWAGLSELARPDHLCHGLWMILDDPDRVLATHHAQNGAPIWQPMVEGDWPREWEVRGRAVGAMAAAWRQATRHPGRERYWLSKAPGRPPHWSSDQWEALASDIDPSVLLDAAWILTNDPPMVLADLRGRPAGTAQVNAEMNTGQCWFAGTGSVVPAEVASALIRFGAARGDAGFTRHDAVAVLGRDGAPKETINGYLRTLVARGELERIPRAAPGRGGGDLYRVTLGNSEPTEPTG